MNKVQVQSTNIKWVRFENNVLEVEFKQGAIYQYSPVSENQYLQLLSSESKSKWINENIKKNPTIKYKKV